MLRVVPTSDTYWTIEINNVKLGSIERFGTTGWWRNNPPYEYIWMSTLTVARQGRRVFGSRCGSFKEAVESAKRFYRELAIDLLEGDTQ